MSIFAFGFEPHPQGFTAEIMNDWSRCVVTSGVVTRGFATGVRLLKLQDKRFENLSEHLWIDRYILVERGVLAHGKVILLQNIIEHALKGVITHLHARTAKELVLALLSAKLVVEQAAV